MSGFLPSLDRFSQRFSKYPQHTLSLYHIYRDLVRKHAASRIAILDGEECGFDRWVVACEHNERSRLIYPLQVEEGLDLSALLDGFLLLESINYDLYVAVASNESIT